MNEGPVLLAYDGSEHAKLAIQRAMRGEPKIDEVLPRKDTLKHPFYK